MLKGVSFPAAGMERFYLHTGGYQGTAENQNFQSVPGTPGSPVFSSGHKTPKVSESP